MFPTEVLAAYLVAALVMWHRVQTTSSRSAVAWVRAERPQR